MKIYLFNPVNGAYLGEAFADEAPWRRGEYLLPDDATLIPPPQGEPGEVPCFNSQEQRWEFANHDVRAASRLRDTLDNNV
jgi:hypothetical protein